MEPARREHVPVETRDFVLEAGHDLEHIRASLADRVEGDDLLAGAKDFRSGFAVPELGAADIAQIDGDAVANGDNDVLDVFGRPIFADGAHDVAALAFVEIAAAEVTVLAL